MKKSKQKALICAVLLLAAVCIGGFLLNSNNEEPEKSSGGRSLTGQLALLVVGDTVETVKNELELALQDILEERPESARQRIGTVSAEIDGLRKPLEQGIAILSPVMPSKAKRLEDAQILLDAVDLGLQEILLPAIDVVQAHPISQMKVGEGFNTGLLGHYLDFAESRMPQIEQVLELVNSVDLSFLDGEMAGICAIWSLQTKSWRFTGRILLFWQQSGPCWVVKKTVSM